MLKDIFYMIIYSNRSPFAAAFLREKGFDAKFLEEGLLELMKKLKGGEAKKFLEN